MRSQRTPKLVAQIDPYGALSLLCLLIGRTKKSKKVNLLIDDRQICQYLKTIKFFYHLENECGDSVNWNKKILSGAEIHDTEILMPIHAIKSKGGERIIAENLLQHLRKQGFKDSVGRSISIVLGELADNAMTHSNNTLTESVCYVSAKRFIWSESNCVIISVADPGIGIPASLKGNPEYKNLTDEKALVTAFKPFVTSWINTKRGKGLTDVLSIALGNHSMLRVDCGPIGLSMDLRENGKPLLETTRNPMANVNGTRIGLILIDTNFEKTERSEIETLISRKAGEL